MVSAAACGRVFYEEVAPEQSVLVVQGPDAAAGAEPEGMTPEGTEDIGNSPTDMNDAGAVPDPTSPVLTDAGPTLASEDASLGNGGDRGEPGVGGSSGTGGVSGSAGETGQGGTSGTGGTGDSSGGGTGGATEGVGGTGGTTAGVGGTGGTTAGVGGTGGTTAGVGGTGGTTAGVGGTGGTTAGVGGTGGTTAGVGGTGGTGGQTSGAGGAGTGGAGGAGAGGVPGGTAVCVPDADCTCADYEGGEYRLCVTEATYQEAQTSCESAGMALVRVDDQAENDWLLAEFLSLGLFLAVSQPMVFLGGTDAAVNGEWRWSDGDVFWNETDGAVLYTNWWPNFPKPGEPGDCVGMLEDGTWAERACTSGSVTFACEIR